jgi:hypothetical protein
MSLVVTERRFRATAWMSVIGRNVLQKYRKLQRHEFFAKTTSAIRSLIRIPSIALPKSPVSLTREDQSPQVFTPKTRLQSAEFLITCAKRLLQQYRGQSGHAAYCADWSKNPKADIAARQNKMSLDHLVGLSNQQSWHNEPNGLRCLQVDDKFKGCRLFNRKLARLGALQNLVNVNRQTSKELN